MTDRCDDIRLGWCQTADLPALQTFLDQHWRAGHILAHHRPLLDWQHFSAEEPSHYRFALAQSGQTGEIQGVLGYIPTSRASVRSPDELFDIWLAIWKVREDAASGGLGLSLLSFVREALRARSIGAVGVNPDVLPIYRLLGYEVGILEQWYLLNPDTRIFRIARLPARKRQTIGRIYSGADPALLLRELELANERSLTEALLKSVDALPVKDWDYVAHRYIHHPVYTYHCYALARNQTDRAILIFRRIEAQGSAMLRMVDYLGRPEALAGASAEFIRLLQIHSAEYLDFQCQGFKPAMLHAGGLQRRNPMDADFILPTYFEPFIQEDVPLQTVYKSNSERSYRFVLGDSDQDRPNLLPVGGLVGASV